MHKDAANFALSTDTALVTQHPPLENQTPQCRTDDLPCTTMRRMDLPVWRSLQVPAGCIAEVVCVCCLSHICMREVELNAQRCSHEASDSKGACPYLSGGLCRSPLVASLRRWLRSMSLMSKVDAHCFSSVSMSCGADARGWFGGGVRAWGRGMEVSRAAVVRSHAVGSGKWGVVDWWSGEWGLGELGSQDTAGGNLLVGQCLCVPVSREEGCVAAASWVGWG
jgi:hypothetical protein